MEATVCAGRAGFDSRTAAKKATLPVTAISAITTFEFSAKEKKNKNFRDEITAIDASRCILK